MFMTIIAGWGFTFYFSRIFSKAEMRSLGQNDEEKGNKTENMDFFCLNSTYILCLIWILVYVIYTAEMIQAWSADSYQIKSPPFSSFELFW